MNELLQELTDWSIQILEQFGMIGLFIFSFTESLFHPVPVDPILIAMDAMEILPEYQGILVHDHWKPYNHYNCTHSYCNAHLLRELTGVSEKESMQWSKEMHTLLTKMNNTVHKSKNSDKEYLAQLHHSKIKKTYFMDFKAFLEFLPVPHLHYSIKVLVTSPALYLMPSAS